MAKDRVIPVRFSPGTDDDLYNHLLTHKERTATGGSSGEAKRLMRAELTRRNRTEVTTPHEHTGSSR